MFLAHILPHPTNCYIYPLSPDIYDVASAVVTAMSGGGINPESVSRKKMYLRFFSAGIDTERPGRLVGY